MANQTDLGRYRANLGAELDEAALYRAITYAIVVSVGITAVALAANGAATSLFNGRPLFFAVRQTLFAVPPRP